MGKKGLPNWQTRQKLLYSKDKKGSAEELSKYGEIALQKEQFQDALEYFRIAQNLEGLTKLKKIALEEGDSFLLLAIEHLGDPFDTQLWNQIGQRARELGKLRFAQMAFQKAGNESMLSQVTQSESRADDSESPRPADTAHV